VVRVISPLNLGRCVLSAEARDRRPMTLRRTKREWILPPTKLMENTDYTNTEFIAKIHSDKQTNMEVKYYLSGPGADKPPFNLFVVDYITGFVRITAKLDREKTPFFNLSGRAIFTDGTAAEDDIPLNVIVLDMNDNTPYFELHTGNISEASKKGTLVMQIQGKDDDEAGTDNSKISYSIASQEPRGTGHMFTIDAETGQLYVKEATLDRETCDFYKLVVHGSDLGGAPGGRTGTGTVEIRVLDINDNIPTLEKSEYNGNVDENVADVVVMRIKALDNDLAHTDNWVTVFEIAKGNENNLFSIETDRKTNEGILKLIKAVDFEKVKKLELGLVIRNVAPFVEGEALQMDVDVQVGEGGPLVPGASGASGADLGLDAGGDVGVGLGLDPVNNVPEGPAFIPDTKKVPVSEDPKEAPKDGVITVFTAVDPDTGKTAEDVSYAKAYDPDKWFTIDKETAEIKLIKVPDRESPFLVNGTYIAKILAITKDMPSKTATGTIAIQVLDHNDHCPTLTTTRSTLCSDVKTVNVTGFDEDVSPNAAPFTFRIIPKGTRGSWDVEVINETSAALHSREALWPGSYQLQVEVVDAKGLSCPANEIFTVDVCTCVDTGDCRVKAARLGSTSSKFSASAIGLMLAAMCLLLFIPLLLLFFQCGGAGTIFPDQFSDLPFDAKEHLMSYHTEGRGEDKVRDPPLDCPIHILNASYSHGSKATPEVPLQSVPIKLGTREKVCAPVPNFNTFPSKTTGNQKTSIYDESVYNIQEISQSFIEVDNIYRFSRDNYGNGGAAFGMQQFGVQHTTSLFDDIALSDAFLKDYYSQKAMCAVPLNDGLLEYGFEGQGSSAGSVGCCSLLESDNDLHFLDDLGFKFKTLAEICSPPTPTPTPVLTHTMVMSSTNISKSSVRTVSTALPPMTLPPSKVTNIGHSSNISHSASLPRQTQTVILQQQPVYYTTSPVLQPMHYVVQPRLQNTVLLASGAPRANLPGMYVVSGSQSTSSGLLIRGPQGSPSGPVIQST
uniref:Si:ch73-74h11.1 n=1 Tax=Sander lucioperca TaxID=283035 RepID=A0A8D0D910_SANLU